VGNARTALFNWLFARQHGGAMVLRIDDLRVEDTDVERSEAGFEEHLLADLKWLGLDWDEGPDIGGPFGPYRQSARLDLYREHAERMLREDRAYLCFCSDEELHRERDRAIAEQRQPAYSGACRQIGAVEAERRRAAGEPCAIRLRVPQHAIRFHDIVRGDIEFPQEVVGDPVILRSTGTPVYNYAAVIDDSLMKITHVIRGEVHLSNTPKQIALYEALGWPVPEFAHLSTILGADRTRLSREHGAASIAKFREQGTLPEALMNYLALLGWAPSGGTREIFDREELIREFALERVTPSPAVFDPEKLSWVNRQYIKQNPPERIEELARSHFVEAGLLSEQEQPDVEAWFRRVVAVFVPSVDRLEELPQRMRLIFSYDPKSAMAARDNSEVLAEPSAQSVMTAFARRIQSDELAQNDQLTSERFKAIAEEVKTETGAAGKELLQPIRIMLTGWRSGPDFEKLIPILEEGSRLPLKRHVMSVRERAAVFAAQIS
jgi:nondiscriminating glutamyl-tRNA synthetase